jgi:hypothetical protein
VGFKSPDVSASFAAYEAMAADIRAGRRGPPSLIRGWGEAARVARAAAEAVARAVADGPAAEGVPKDIAESARTAARASEQRRQAELLRCVFGNPARPPPAPYPAVLARNGGATRRLAESIYTARRFEDLPVLADLLEEAGCYDAELVGHLRGPGPHVLGCHALDAVLGKEPVTR